MSFTIFQNEKAPFQPIKSRSSNIDIFLKGLTHGFGPKMAILPTFFFQAIQAKEMSFTIFQSEKTPVQGIKTTSSKSPKIDIFAEGLTHGFGSKMAVFQTFCVIEYRPRKYLSKDENTPFQGIKTRILKSRKIDIFPKGLTHGFVQKWLFLQLFVFRQYRLGKCLLRYCRRKKRLSRL